MNQPELVIIGKHAKTGSRVNQRLQALGHTTRAVSRSTPLAFDWRRPETWKPALQGARAAWITYQPDLALPRAEADMRRFVHIAREAGLEHLVLLSGRGESGAERAEAIIRDSGLDWNVVRASWFAQNFSESFMLDGILAGELVLPADATVEPFIDVDDIADVAVAALTRPALRNRLFEVTGPRAMSFADCVDEISRQLGRPLRFTPIPIDDYIEALRQDGVDEDMQWLLRELFTVVFDGRNSRVTHGVEEALGRPATDFSDYVRKTRSSGAWTQADDKQTA